MKLLSVFVPNAVPVLPLCAFVPSQLSSSLTRGFKVELLYSEMMFRLQIQQPFFAPQSTTITNQGLIASNNAVTGNNDTDIIFAVGRSHSPNCFQVTILLCQLIIADGFSIRYFAKQGPNL